MAEVPTGDDQYGEDPSVNRLQERIAELLGKEVALLCRAHNGEPNRAQDPTASDR
jgi:threonine aldolase